MCPNKLNSSPREEMLPLYFNYSTREQVPVLLTPTQTVCTTVLLFIWLVKGRSANYDAESSGFLIHGGHYLGGRHDCLHE